MRGAVQTRGGKRPTRGGDLVDNIAGTLQRIRTDDTASDYLRLKAGEVLAYLPRDAGN